MINRSQGIVLAFFAVAWLMLVGIYVLDPAIYAGALRAPARQAAPFGLVFLFTLTVFLCVLATGVVRRWRWMFWLIVIAFAAGIVRVPASALEIAGALPPSGPVWYEALQGVIGVVQVAIAAALIAGYRNGAGAWGRF